MFNHLSSSVYDHFATHRRSSIACVVAARHISSRCCLKFLGNAATYGTNRPARSTKAHSLPDFQEAAQRALSVSHSELALMDPGAIWWPLLLSTIAGLSTGIGGLIAVSFSPKESTLAFLLGTAIGVMATVSGVELWWHAAVELDDMSGVTAAVAAGAVLFAVLDPLLPKHAEPEALLTQQAEEKPQQQHQVQQHVSIDLNPMQQQQQQQPRQSELAGRVSSIGSPISNQPVHHSASTVTESSIRPMTASGSSSSGGGGSSSHGNRKCHAAEAAAAAAEDSSATAGNDDDVKGVSDKQMERLPLIQPGTVMSSAFDTNSSSSGGGGSCDVNPHHHHTQLQQQEHQQSSSSSSSNIGSSSSDSAAVVRAHHANMLRLGLVMAITLTIHNLPEGFAVAFSAFTNIGPIMTLAIALHNIPEGLVIAAPLYAATGSKLQALGLTAASGLSEPIGALAALLVFKPFVTSVRQLDYVLAATGGVMLAVCVLELWPEGRRCGENTRLVQGMVLGSAVMAWTLYMGA